MATAVIQGGQDPSQGLVAILRGLVEMQTHSPLGSRIHRASTLQWCCQSTECLCAKKKKIVKAPLKTFFTSPCWNMVRINLNAKHTRISWWLSGKESSC